MVQFVTQTEITEPEVSRNLLPEAIRKKLSYIITTKNESLPEKFRDFVVPFQAGSLPVDVRKLYPDYSGYTLELGSGWGEFAIESARINAKILHIGLDKKKYRIKKSIKEQLKASIENIRWMVCRFEWVFQGLFETHSIDSCIINFPDPWPKTRHQKHRFVGPELIQELARIIKPGGNLEFATDNWSYMYEALPLFEQFGDWKNLHGKNVILPRIEHRPVSFFENLKRSESENIYIVCLQKV